MKTRGVLQDCTRALLWAACFWAACLLGAPSPVTKVVYQYALTSANDFPQRDPQDWRLLGSNDGGKTWTSLDIRRGEIFSERHQRRVFKVAAPAAFNVYRLQIDQVRGVGVADSVHLAEIEPLGQSEDDLSPVPSLEDLITVQGENPPLESRFQAFDNQAETKWLDFAAQNPVTRASWIQWQYTRQVGLVVTNIRQLQGLRAQAGGAYPVRIEGVLVDRLPGTNRLCFLDDTGFLEVAAPPDTSFSPGQRLLLEGTTQWSNRQVEIEPCRLTALGQKVAVAPKRISLEQELEPEDEFQWVEAEGTIQFCTWPENHLVFELHNNERSISVQVLHLDPSARPALSGAYVRVRGICGGSRNAKGQLIASTLWACSLSAIMAVPPRSGPLLAGQAEGNPGSDSSSPVLTTIRQVRQLSPEELSRRPRVEVRGVITEVFGNYLQDETAGIELWLDTSPPQQPAPPALGTCAEVSGLADWIEGHGPVIRTQKILPLGKGKLPKPERPTWSQLASGKIDDQWIEIEGVIRSTDGSHMLLICEGGQMMATIRAAPAALINGLVDATVRLRGLNTRASDDRGRDQGIQLLVPSLEYVEVEHPPEEAFALPSRPIGSLFQLRGSREMLHRVKVEGVLTFREDRRFFLQDASGSAMAIDKEDVVLDLPPGAYHWAFFQTPEGKRNRAEGWDLKVGDQVQVVGFPESREGYSAVLTEVLVRKVGHTTSVSPVKTTVTDIALGRLDSTLVSVEATVLGLENLGSHFVLELQSGQRVFQAVLPASREAPLQVASGSRVRVTGVCQIEPSPFPELGKKIASFKILLGSASAVTVLERPPWWTLKRALAAAAALIVVLAIAAAWIGVLHRQVEQRTLLLKREIQEHERTEAKLADKTALLEKEIEERKRIEAEVEKSHKQLLRSSRLAGMAEVATNVLHNVGNVLNSANMLASVIAEHVRRSKVHTLVKAVELLKLHRGELGYFITQDERGRHLPALLEQLGSRLAEENSALMGKVDALTQSVQHIKEVVTMQQRYAKVSGMSETVSLAEVVEDALRLEGGALARHEIRVLKQYEEVPKVTVDRHKVLQILFNLLENAKHACVESGRPGKQVTIRIQQDGPGRVQVQVVDDGVGIAAENLPRIFSQGFSTRKNGHGFGLHSSILTAQDMGGSLSAQSEGPGKGAVFILTFPVTR